MRADKYNRSIPVNCPTCGGTDFEIPDGSEAEPVTCVRCGRTISPDGLIRENSENISEHVKEVKSEVLKDFKKEFTDSFRRTFKGNKNIRIK